MSALRKLEGFGPLALAKLESSGLSAAQATALGMYDVANAQTLHPGFDAVPALTLPYYAISGKPAKGHPKWPDFYRIRYLATTTKSFADASGKPKRYTQPPDTGVCAYFPNCTPWETVINDVRETILITEGELKAAKACYEGFPTIGLGGVYNFRRAAQGVFFIPDLEQVKWARRRVVIVYDSDYQEKPDICSAINAIAEELEERGAIVSLARLPQLIEGEKTGLDDYLVAKSADDLVAIVGVAEPLVLTRTLWQLNDELCYVRDPGLVIGIADDLKLSPSGFAQHSDWSTLNTPERKVSARGTVTTEKVSAAPAWLKWPLRRSVKRLTYRPGAERFTTDNFYNAWKGWGCVPAKGDITPWLALVKFLFEGAEPAFVEWFYDWCAYPIQHPGTKLFSAMVVHGDTTGTGKTLLGYTLGRIYGANFTKIENKHLRSGFNGWAENRQFVLGDEISGSDKRAEADAMKTVITQEEISINIKNVPEYTVPDCINYYFTSNHADAFFIEDKDRRYAVHEVTQEAPLPDAFYLAYDAWKDGTGPAALFHWLLQRDVSKFNPKAPAFRTAARNRMSMMGKSDLAVWCQELKEAPEQVLRMGQMRHQRDLFTSTELLAMYQTNNEGGLKVTANGLARALAAAGFRQVHNGDPLLVEGKQRRYFAVRNSHRWLRVKSLRELAKHLALPLIRD